MSHATKLMIRADDVCAYLWARSDSDTRGHLCSAARVSSVQALLEWHEFGQAERIPLMVAIVGEIESAVGLMRLEQRATAGAAS